jgi:hypothetical protein
MPPDSAALCVLEGIEADGLNDIVANAPADDSDWCAGDIFGVDISARKDGWSGDTARRWWATRHPRRSPVYAVSQQVMWLVIGMIRPDVAPQLRRRARAGVGYAGSGAVHIHFMSCSCGPWGAS